MATYLVSAEDSGTDTANSIPRRYAWVVFALTFGLLISDYMSRQVLNAVFPLLKSEWALSDSQLGLLSGIVALMVGLLTFPLSLLADRFGRRKTMITITLLIIVFSFLFPAMLGSGSQPLVMGFLLLGLSIMGLTFGPMGALLPELFPTEVRYTGASFSYNLSSILGASVAPYIATWLNSNYGLQAVGLYLAAMAVLTLIALIACKETRHQTLYEA